MPILEARDIVKTFESEEGREPLTVLDRASLSVKKGSVATVVGASGSGKSTLLHILGGLDRPDAGSVHWNGDDIYRMDKESLAGFRNSKLGFVFQFHHLLPEFTALENVMMPALIGKSEQDKAANKARDLLNQFGILDRAEHRPSQLSGGEQQRVAMARALINDPELILADEPTGNLDEENTETLLNLLFELRKERDLSILLITHEKNIAERSDHIYQLTHGTLKAI